MLYMQRIKEIFQYIFSKYPSKIDRSILGVNSFFNLKLFRSDNIRNQALDIKNNLNIKKIRILVSWDDKIQKSQDSLIFYGFIDDILKNLPENMSAIMVICNCPSWVSNDKHIARNQFVNFCKSVLSRYGKSTKVYGFQIGNEPNTTMFKDNIKFGFSEDPYYYSLVLRRIYEYKKSIYCDKNIISAATTGILQNYPETLKYFKKMLILNLEDKCDLVGVHFYGNNLFTFFRKNGALDVLKTIKKPIVITEIGTTNSKKQIKYLLKNTNFLEKNLDIDGVFYYHYDGDDEYGMRKTDNSKSKLYDFLSKN